MKKLRIRWAENSSADVAAWSDRSLAAALLPVGSTEAHGPHLPLATDVIIAEAVAERAAARLRENSMPAAVLPSLGYAVCEFAGDVAGTISVRAETVARLIEEIADSLFGHGTPLLVLVNGHLEPAHARMLRTVARSITAGGRGTCLFPDQRLPPIVDRLGEEFGRGGGHGGGYETSLVLAARPDLVDDARRARLQPRFVDIAEKIRSGARTARDAGGEDAWFGDPASASREEGERLLEALSEMVFDAVRRWRKDCAT